MKNRIAYLSLGCDKNRVDTERTLAALARSGFEPVESPAAAAALFINTCGFIEPAKSESIEAVLAGVRAKQAGDYQKLVVAGCLVERYRKELARELPEVDLWLGLEHTEELPGLLPGVLGRKEQSGAAGKRRRAPAGSRFLTTPPHYSFLKVAEGCNAACRFCAIPRIRGRLRSESLDSLIDEALELERSGVKELNLVAQDTTAYGRDLKPRLELADLVEALLAKTRIPWIRILYAHPAHVSDRLIELLAHEDRLLRYLDLPLQHISDKMLKLMGRAPGRRGTMMLLDRLQDSIPELALRTSFLVGHPGESEEDFAELLAFIEEGRFLWASGFVFSAEEGTRSAKLSGRVEREEAERRLFALLEAQEEITGSRLSGYAGRELTLLVDGPWREFVESEEPVQRDGRGSGGGADSSWCARFCGQAVEVDGAVRLVGRARPGLFVRALILDYHGFDLEATC